ncbi:MAG: (2Fe-2S)-binding protein [Saprospiraceae bacterium]|nr:(2Fe-2S)-binding protein [Saprospiraceae bacterium]HMX89204.1 2Fe-2S iron-sulfur cluster-binding protein [Saprospiraceae bacterium]HMZ41140.1 2Fe-2S iron-sulfur cluster-binding protein [Saprospiraceae bacterium]HNA64366.1 2Fe-2S iron-sulfur cluster-binding protein [Saprospiraceae bacterium]HNB30574.1 2Fe-2S iron-sulfur cluster-binding protein [Saprospiraceae bacterium]
MDSNLLKVTIDGRSIEVPPGTTILQAARMIGEHYPPAMCYYTPLKESGGKCRVCLVRVAQTSEANPRPMPKLVASCLTRVENGMVVENESSPEVLEARHGVVEFLLINHPLDCPVCDQAGECDLQNLAFEHGTEQTRYEEGRREFDKIDIGDKIQLHMTRCILCYRCVFTADQITNERVHGVLNRGDAAEIGTYIKHAIENDFSGNIVDVCPVGALTDKTYRFKQRVWFSKPFNAHRSCDKCCGEVVLWIKNNDVIRVTARKNKFGEVEKFICNDCRYDHKNLEDWVIGEAAEIERDSVIRANKYKTKIHSPAVQVDAKFVSE